VLYNIYIIVIIILSNYNTINNFTIIFNFTFIFSIGLHFVLAIYLSFFQLITYGIASASLFAALYKIRPVSPTNHLSASTDLTIDSLSLLSSSLSSQNRLMSHCISCNHESHFKVLYGVWNQAPLEFC